MTSTVFVGWPRSWLGDQSLNRWAILLLALHTLLAIVYSVATPLWEAYDEPSHYMYLQFIANHRQLPAPDDAMFEGKQPPLYYALVGLATFWLQPDAPIHFHYNPSGGTEHPEDKGYNVFIHGNDEAFPYSGLSLGVHLARWLTVLFGTIAAGFTFLTARMIFPRRPALVLTATVLHAFAPMALYLSGLVNNDTLAIAFGSAALYATVRLLSRARSRDLLWTLAALVLGALTKFNALTVAPAAGLAMLIALGHAARTLPRARLRWLLLGVLGLAVLGLFAGWLYLNGLTAREHLDVPISQMLFSLGGFLSNPFSPFFAWQFLPRAFDYGFVSYWALFAWSTLGVAPNIYAALSVFCWLSFAGLLLGFVRGYSRSERANLLLLALGLLSTIVSMAYFVLYSKYIEVFHGRYLLVAVTAISILLATGFANLFPRRWQSFALTALSLAFITWATLLPFQTIAPVYASPSPLPESALPQLPNAMQATFSDLFELVGYQTELESASFGTAFPVTLYWHVLKATPVDFIVAVHLRSLDGLPIELDSVDSLAGQNNFSTSLWTPGTIVPDRHLIRLAPGVSRLTGAQFVVTVFTEPSVPPLPVRSAGAPAQRSATFGRFRVLPDIETPAPPLSPLHYQLGDALLLNGYALSQTTGSLQLTLFWQPLRSPSASYTAFVHVTVDGKLIAQYDGLPLGGALPTDLWRPGDRIADHVQLAIPPPFAGRHLQLWAGMYLAATQQRLSVTDQSGQPVPDDLIPIPLP